MKSLEVMNGPKSAIQIWIPLLFRGCGDCYYSFFSIVAIKVIFPEENGDAQPHP